MTTHTEPTEQQLAEMRAAVARADAKAAAERQAKLDAAAGAVRELVASAEFKAALPAFERALEASPKNVELGYAVNMMERLRDQFAA